jgi:hypothetical protein
MGNTGAVVIPFGFITKHVMTNLRLLIGPFEPSEESDYEGIGYIAAIEKKYERRSGRCT